jgi:hypothetical protein
MAIRKDFGIQTREMEYISKITYELKAQLIQQELLMEAEV